MEVKVISITGQENVLSVDPTDTILSLKEKLEGCEGVGFPPDQLRLIYKGKKLQDDRTVESYKIKNGGILKLVIALRSGIFFIYRFQ